MGCAGTGMSPAIPVWRTREALDSMDLWRQFAMAVDMLRTRVCWAEEAEAGEEV